MLTFNEKEHLYQNDGKTLISTTQLMKKHHLAPSYDFVNSVILERSANRGSLIHKEIENFIKQGNLGFTDEVVEFMKVYPQGTAWKSETMVCNDVVAGTIDLLYMENDVPYIADIKTTSVIHKDAVSWQLSIYLYLYLHYNCEADEEATKKQYYETFGACYHFKKDSTLEIVHIPLKSYEDVERLIDCERKGIEFKYELDDVETELDRLVTLEQVINDLNAQVEEAKKKQEEFRSALIKAMKDRALKTFENENIKITLVQPSKTITTVDVDKMDADIVKAYNEAKTKYDAEAKKYTTTTQKPSKEYLKISLKENINE